MASVDPASAALSATPVGIGLAAAESVANIANAIAGISDMNKRRKFEQNLASLDYDQKIALSKALNDANSESARQQILGDTLGKLDVARIDALGKLQAEKEKTKKTLYILGGIAGIIVVIGLITIFIKRKK
jgi:uncharacterized membrane protein